LQHEGSEARLFHLMVAKARLRDHIYFASDATAAAELGVSRRTIIRWRQRLEEQGLIERIGKRKIGRCKATIVYTFPAGVKRLRKPPKPSDPEHAAYLRSPHWRAVRERYKSKRPWVCGVCPRTNRLHLHHLTYERLGRERLSDLIPLCRTHHMRAHRREANGAPLRTAHLVGR
jgi:DNA-binding Lrp family transcriptional regulator